MRRLAPLTALTIALTLVGQPPSQALDIIDGLAPDPPTVSAASWILYDATFERVLAEHDADLRRAMASTTKVMTAIVALENAELDDAVLVSEGAAGTGEAEIDLVAGETWTVRQLITAMMVRSANDAAVALAEHVGGDVAGFVSMMNAEAAEMGLDDTRFANPHGLDAPGHYSTARDLLELGRRAAQDEFLAAVINTRVATLPADPNGVERVARTTNELISTYEGAFGVKTGFTDDAGQVLIAAAERDGRRIYAVVMGSEDHFADAAALMTHGFRSFGMFQLIVAGEEYAFVRRPGSTSPAVAVEPVDVFTDVDTAAATDVTPAFADDAPVLEVQAGGEVLGTTPLRFPDPEPLPTLRDALSWASRYWDWLWGTG